MAKTNDLIPIESTTGVTEELPPDQFTAIETAAGVTVKTATADFEFAYNGVILTFRNGDPFTPDAALLAALTAANAPIQ